MVYKPRYLKKNETESVVICADTAPYLIIELGNIDSIPKVLLEGKEVDNIKQVGYSWETATPDYDSPNSFMIEHYEQIDGKPKVIKEGFESAW
ncbi:hypothetical protein [Enterococcus sp. BWR-S5]|uniref:hypothetical protein n=1 Tax=Enterococcus sp. BWR-S5 TaxID=2787714 RepID=UPI0019236FE0|nr:hypothetical protein [Enterococcus sp. BWR-S5]MBL1224801.1 hypothetical protein [Enterococcus sp. BWR-S5]